MKNESLSILLIVFAVLLLNTEVDPMKAPIVNSEKIIPIIESPTPTTSAPVAPNPVVTEPNIVSELKECCSFTDSRGNENICYALKGSDCSYCACN